MQCTGNVNYIPCDVHDARRSMTRARGTYVRAPRGYSACYIYIYIHIYSASIVIVMRAALRTRISWYLSTRKADHRHYSIYLSTFYTPLMHDTIIISKAWCNANLRSVSGKPCGYILYYWQTHKEKPIQLYIYIYIGFVKNNNVRE